MALPKIWKFDGELVSFSDLTPDTRNFVFTIPEDFVFTPGQFITAVLRTEEGKQLRRSYSIASAPSHDTPKTIELCIKKIDDGEGTKILFNLQEGDTVNFMGPLGHFVVKDEQEDMIFIGVGTGVSPYRSMVPALLAKGFENNITLLAGFRHHVLYHEEWQALDEKHDNFTYVPTLSQPQEDLHITKGRVTDSLDSLDLDSFTGRFYLCGLWEMIQEVGKKLASKGIGKERIVFERYD